MREEVDEVPQAHSLELAIGAGGHPPRPEYMGPRLSGDDEKKRSFEPPGNPSPIAVGQTACFSETVTMRDDNR